MATTIPLLLQVSELMTLDRETMRAAWTFYLDDLLTFSGMLMLFNSLKAFHLDSVPTGSLEFDSFLTNWWLTLVLCMLTTGWTWYDMVTFRMNIIRNFFKTIRHCLHTITNIFVIKTFQRNNMIAGPSVIIFQITFPLRQGYFNGLVLQNINRTAPKSHLFVDITGPRYHFRARRMSKRGQEMAGVFTRVTTV